MAERWTPIVVRNLITGAETFTELADGAPGMSRTLLTARLRELERVGVITIDPHPRGRGHLYHPTRAGMALRPVLVAMGTWAEEWFELNPEDSDPGFLLHNWCHRYLAVERLPPRRVVTRFVFTDQPPKQHQMWVIFDRAESEVCLTDPGMDVDLVVTGESTALAGWHLGRLEWAHALRAGAIFVTGPRDLARALPTWNRRSVWAAT
ncbi:MAG: winged helix-turn-helix transcriptional regulator [Ornithinimicrobium sp.]